MCQEIPCLQRRQSPTPHMLAAGIPHGKMNVRLKLRVFMLRADEPGMCHYHPERQAVRAGNQQKGSDKGIHRDVFPTDSSILN